MRRSGGRGGRRRGGVERGEGDRQEEWGEEE